MFLSWSSCWTFLVLVGKDPDVFHHSNSQCRSWNSMQSVQVKPVEKVKKWPCNHSLWFSYCSFCYHWSFFVPSEHYIGGLHGRTSWMGENLSPPRSDQKVYTDGHICGTINLTSFPTASLGRMGLDCLPVYTTLHSLYPGDARDTLHEGLYLTIAAWSNRCCEVVHYN